MDDYTIDLADTASRSLPKRDAINCRAIATARIETVGHARGVCGTHRHEVYAAYSRSGQTPTTHDDVDGELRCGDKVAPAQVGLEVTA